MERKRDKTAAILVASLLLLGTGFITGHLHSSQQEIPENYMPDNQSFVTLNENRSYSGYLKACRYSTTSLDIAFYVDNYTHCLEYNVSSLEGIQLHE